MDNRDSKISIYIAHHMDKRFLPPSDPIYKPMFCGAVNAKETFGYMRDDEGSDNLSKYNKNFCELTAQYWAWKNDLDSNILGLVHYHRFFVKDDKALDKEEILNLLENHDAIINGETSSKFIEKGDKDNNVYEHYKECHKQQEMDLALEACKKLYPDDYTIFRREIMHQDCIATNNMIIARRPIFEEYSQWLFDILFYVQKNGDISGYDDYNKRAYGFLSERIQRVFFVCRGYNTTSVDVGDVGNDRFLNGDRQDDHDYRMHHRHH